MAKIEQVLNIILDAIDNLEKEKRYYADQSNLYKMQKDRRDKIIKLIREE